MKKLWLSLGICFLFSHASYAYASDSNIDFYAGAEVGTYQNISEDLKHLLVERGVELKLHATDGSIDNIKKIAASNKAAIGLVQADVLSFMRRSSNPDTQKLAERIRMMLPLYQEEVHILTSKSIKRFDDLKGKKVVVGEQGSGNMLTAINLLAISDIKVGETMQLSPPQGVLAVLEGRADAVIYVGGKPVKLFKNIEYLETADGKKFSTLLENVHFIPISSPKILAEYAAATITPEDYRFVESIVPTIAVQAVLITGNYDSKEEKPICQLIGKTAKIIRTNIGKLRKTGHPKWHDINLSLPVSLWEKDSCSWPGAAAEE